MITFCPKCHQKYGVSDSLKGREVECSECGEVFIADDDIRNDPHESTNMLSIEQLEIMAKNRLADDASSHIGGNTSGITLEKGLGFILFLLAVIAFIMGIFSGLDIGGRYSSEWGWYIFFCGVVSAIIFLSIGVILFNIDDNVKRLDRLEKLLSKKK